ncbi:flagellar motor switch protein FliG [bacterium]|nr:flagellar motor switch protein FliG [bacterium]
MTRAGREAATSGATAPADLKGVTRAAMLMVALGKDAASEITRHLSDEELAALSAEIAALGAISADSKRAVLRDFAETAQSRDFMVQGGEEYAREVLVGSLGERRAKSILGRLHGQGEGSYFGLINGVDALSIAMFLKKEHPQTIALVLSTLPTPQAGQILAALPEDARTSVAYRMATIERPSPEVIAEIQAVLGDFVQTEVPDLGAKFGGTSHLASSLNEIDQGVWRGILDGIEDLDAAVAQDIKNQMFTFSDLVLLDNKSIQAVMKEVDSKDLALSLKGATQEVRELVFGNMSKRATTAIREEMDYMGPVRVSEVEAAQGRIIDVVRRLEAEGAIYIAGRGGKEGGIIE